MKKTIILTGLLVLGILTANAQEKTKVGNLPAVLRENAAIDGKEVLTIKQNEEVEILDYIEPYFKVKHKDKEGFIRYTMLVLTDNMTKKVENSENSIALKIGMSETTVKKKLGEPDKINTSTGSYGVHEQWIYERKSMYIYIENGILTSWQGIE